MKGKIIIIMVLAIALLVGAGAVLAGTIVNSKHDLNPDSTATIKASGTQQNKEICIWCHTPHFASAITPALEQGSSSNCLHSVWNYRSRHGSLVHLPEYQRHVFHAMTE